MFEDLVLLVDVIAPPSSTAQKRVTSFVDTFDLLVSFYLHRPFVGILTLLAGGNKKARGFQRGSKCNLKRAQFSSVTSIVVADNNNILFVADRDNRIIRKINTLNKTDEIILGEPGVMKYQDGRKFFSKMVQPFGMVVDPTNQYLYISEQRANTVRRAHIRQQTIESYCANQGCPEPCSISQRVQLSEPTGLCFDSNETLYICNHGSNDITCISKDGKVYYLISPLNGVSFKRPLCIVPNPDNHQELFFTSQHEVMKLHIPTKTLTCLAGSKPAGSTNREQCPKLFNNPTGLCYFNRKLYIADRSNDCIRQIDLLTKTVSTVVKVAEPISIVVREGALVIGTAYALYKYQ